MRGILLLIVVGIEILIKSSLPPLESMGNSVPLFVSEKAPEEEKEEKEEGEREEPAREEERKVEREEGRKRGRRG